MRLTPLLLATALTLCTSGAIAQATFPAMLAGHAMVPARTFVAAPPDAPADLRVSGTFTTGRHVEAISTVEGKSAGRPTGAAEC